MSIELEHVEGVVQREAGAGASPDGAEPGMAPAAPARPLGDQLDEALRRRAWLTRRLEAD